MVWGCFSYYGVGKLVRIEGIMDQKKYKSILRQNLVQSARQLFPRGNWIFQQDNDPKHTAASVRNYMQNMGFKILRWPAQSPDLNPIENLWSELDRLTKHRKPQTEEQLYKMLIDGWNQLSLAYLHKLVDSMPRRIEAVIKNHGYSTKY
jgi:transposase